MKIVFNFGNFPRDERKKVYDEEWRGKSHESARKVFKNNLFDEINTQKNVERGKKWQNIIKFHFFRELFETDENLSRNYQIMVIKLEKFSQKGRWILEKKIKNPLLNWKVFTKD